MPLAVTLVLHAGLATFAPGPAAGQAEPPPLEWVAPPECPTREQGTELLAGFLGGQRPAVPVRIELSATGHGYRARVEVQGASRTLEASRCELAGRAAALVVAVALDPVATAYATRPDETSPDETAPEVPPPTVVPEPPTFEAPPPLDVAPAPAPAPRPEPERRRTRRASDRADMPPRAEPTPELASAHSLGVSGGITRAHVPALTGAVRLSYAFDRGSLRLQTDATYATPRRIAYPAEPSVGGRFQSVSVAVRACFAPGSARVLVPLCAGVEGGPVIGRGFGVDEARRPVAAWVGALASASVLVRVHPRVAMGAGADLVGSLRRPAFHVGARETLFRSPPVGLQAMAGLELRLR